MKVSLTSISIAVPLLIGASIGAASSAQAALITGDVQFNGSENVTFNRKQLDFGSNGIGNDGGLSITSTSGDFSSVTSGFIKDLVAPAPLSNLINLPTFNAPVANFVQFVGSQITFDLEKVTRTLNPGIVAFLFEGTLRANGLNGKDDTPFSFSVISANPTGFPNNLPNGIPFNQNTVNSYLGNSGDGITRITSFSGNVSGAKVPEPMTMLGSTLALASIAALKRKKRSEKLATTKV